MRGFIGFTKRNLLLYFKDVATVVFSLLTSIIVLSLYLVFLKNNYVDAINSLLGPLDKIIKTSDIDSLVREILLVGILGTSTITVPYSCLTTIIKDKEQRIDYDISATPLKRWQIILSYFLAAAISAIVVTGAILAVGLIVISFAGSMHMGVVGVLKVFGVVVLGAISSTSFFMVLVLFFKSSSASGSFFGMLSAASGFVIGAYIPISQFSESVQTVCNLFPATHITVMYRNVLLGGNLEYINDKIDGRDQGMFLEGIKEAFSFDAKLFGHVFTNGQMIAYVGGIILVCLVAMVAIYRKNYKR